MWIILSPHLDDAIYSLGARLAQWARQGETVEVWTLCAGDPPPGPLSPLAALLHQVWGLSADQVLPTRRAEDRAACRLLGLTPVHWDVPDAIYRRGPTGEPLYPDLAALNGSLHPADQAQIPTLAERLRRARPQGARLVAPLAIGGHVDHRLARAVAEAAGEVTAYYADFPYAARDQGREALQRLPHLGWRLWLAAPQDEASLEMWVQGIATYASQRSAFWASEEELAQEVAAFARAGGGALWVPSQSTG